MLSSKFRYSIAILMAISLLLSGCSADENGLSDSEVYALIASLVEPVKIWTHPADLSDNISIDGQAAEHSRVAMDTGGNAIITWHQSNGANTQIFKSEYRGGAWIHPTGLSDNISPDGHDASLPAVAMDAGGNAIITWQQHDGANFQIFKSEYRDGAWIHPSDINTDHISIAGYMAASPQVAMDASGNAIITWLQYDGANFQIFKSEYRGGSWAHPTNINTDHISVAGYDAEDPQVAMDASGNAIIVWEQFDGARNQIFKSEYRNGSWANPTNINTDHISPGGQFAEDPRVAMDASGNAIITWFQNDGAKKQIFKSEYRNGAWTNPSDLSDNISIDGYNAVSPEVAMDASGNAIITWAQSDGIFKSEYRGGVWTNPSDLSDNISIDGESAFYPQVAMDASGHAIITWYQIYGLYYRVFKSEYRGGVWTNPSDLSDNISPDGAAALYPRVAMDVRGNAIITWQQSDGANPQVFKSEYR